ncbi:MAG TPA: MFS transporter [Candidatus Binatia bacterium]|nr:MFS transporter [Candidatus Binatia bacterium]
MRTQNSAGISRNTVLLAFASLFADISSEMLYPILPIFLTQVLHGSGSVVGMVEGIAEATQNVAQGFSGWLSDKLQKRKTLALIGYFVSALGKPLMGIATAWAGVLVGRFLDRAGAGFRSAPRDALIASSVSDEYRGRAFGLEGIGDNLGAFLGPLLAVLLFVSFQVKIRWLFLFAVIPGLLAFLLVLLVHDRPVRVAAKSKIDTGFREFPIGYWKFLVVIAVFQIGNSSNSFLILQTKSIGASFTLTILIYAGFNLMAALISYPAGSLSDRWGRRNILLAAFLIFFVAYFGFARARSVVAIAVLFVFYGLFQGIFRSVGKALALDFVPEHLRASAVGWYSTAVGLLALVASFVAGLLWDHVGHAAVFYYGAISAIAGSFGLLWIPGKHHRTSLDA